MAWTIVLGAGVGTVLGFLTGRSRKCGTGACTLTTGPIMGAISGALLGGIVVVAFVTSGCRSARPLSEQLSEQRGDVELIKTAEQFDRTVLEGTTPVLVDFFADWCPPCKVLAPILESLSQDYTGRTKFVKVDVDESKDLAGRYKIEALPTVVLFSGGGEVHRWVGLQEVDRYRQVIDSHLTESGKDK